MTSATSTSRRAFLASAAASTLAFPMISAAATRRYQARPFRLVFMPCIHLRDEHQSPAGLAAALDAVRALSPRADVIITGGDLIQNARDLSPEAAEAKAEQFLSIFKQHAPPGLPVHHMIGNHDIAGWRESRDQWDPNDPLFAKGLLLSKMQMPARSYAIAFGGWRLIMLDNIFLTEPGQYISRFDEECLALVRRETQDHPSAPALVFSHVPAVTATEFFDGRAQVKDDQWTLATGRMADNPSELLKAAGDTSVRTYVSGHIHDVDDIRVAGARFICSGSVSGQQWTGPKLPRPGCEEGVGLFDCRPDGSFDYTYHDYGWEAVAPEPR